MIRQRNQWNHKIHGSVRFHHYISHKRFDLWSRPFSQWFHSAILSLQGLLFPACRMTGCYTRGMAMIDGPRKLVRSVCFSWISVYPLSAKCSVLTMCFNLKNTVREMSTKERTNRNNFAILSWRESKIFQTSSIFSIHEIHLKSIPTWSNTRNKEILNIVILKCLEGL